MVSVANIDARVTMERIDTSIVMFRNDTVKMVQALKNRGLIVNALDESYLKIIVYVDAPFGINNDCYKQ